MQEQSSKHNRNPWLWIPTLYFVEGLPYFIVNTISVVMFKDLGMDNGTLALLTSLISLPWVVKPLWSPFVDLIRTKRWWIVAMQLVMLAAVALVAFSVRLTTFTVTLILFIVAAFASATHDIAADGFYMLALDQRRQSAFVGIRSTFYRIAMVFGSGVLVVLAGILERRLGNVPAAWSYTMLLSAGLLALFSVYHLFILPRPAEDRSNATASGILKGFGEAFASFFRKPGVWLAIAFMLLYRLPEALSVKMLFPFFKDGTELGGLGFSTETYGLVYGSFGVIALLAGGILGGLAAARLGLRKCMWPMALALALPCSVYLYMSLAQPQNVWVVGSCVVLDQFGYGFGFSAYMLYMMHFSEGPLKTSHYAICTAFMALSMMLPGLVAGYLQQALGYIGFFVLVMICCIATFFVTFFARRRL
ncbi:MAG: MFS transporter [Bacteroidales bacterium]|nr:MFS transporter [Bacteroidales bacterium]